MGFGVSAEVYYDVLKTAIGSVYFMCGKASGFDWKFSSNPTEEDE